MPKPLLQRKARKKLEADTDFEYVKSLPEEKQRLAAFYEYARESDELKDAVRGLREAGVFKAGYTQSDIKPELMSKLISGENHFPIEGLYVLSQCDDFPEKTFHEAELNADILKQTIVLLGSPRPAALPWKAIIAMRNYFTRDGRREIEFYENRIKGSTLHAIAIPWYYTNEELADFFREMIPTLRPSDIPEPKKAGRTGRCSGGAVDMLNQLAAFRWNRAGVGFDDAANLTIYTSKKGWQKAVRAAEERISNMTKRSLFG